MNRRFVIALSALTSVVACSEAPGDRFEIDVAPLELAGIVEACYALTVTNAPDGAGDIVWSKDDICSTQYGDGAGAITYIGTCDANGNANTVILELTSLTASDGPAEFVNPCGAPDNAPCQLERPCVENTDTLVEFNLTVMRDANQGFFDVAVNFEDIFCSAKVDCDANLLHGSDGERAPTVVVGLACTAGLEADTELYFGDLQLACDDGNVTLDIAGEPGNVYDGDAPAPLDQLATYRGTEQLTDDFGASWAKAYYTVAFALDLPTTKTCRLTGRATASDGPFDEPFTTPLETTYPVIEIDLPLTTAGATDYACDVHPIGRTRADGIWTRYTSLAGGEVFDVRAHRSSGDVIVEEAHRELALSPGNVTLRGGTTQVFTATGGTPPYIFVSGGPGSFTGNVYNVPQIAATYPIRVYDDAGAMAQVTITVEPTYVWAAASTTGLWYSINRHSWVQATTPSGVTNFTGVAFDGGRLVATAATGEVLTSTDGRSYDLLTTVSGLGNELQAVGTSLITGGNDPMFSLDGVSWASAGIAGDNAFVTATGGRLFFADRPTSCTTPFDTCTTSLFEGLANGADPTGTWTNVSFTYADDGFNVTPPRINDVAVVSGGLLLATSGGVFHVAGGVATQKLGGAWSNVAVGGGPFALAVQAGGSDLQWSFDNGQSWNQAFGSAFGSSSPVVTWAFDNFFIAANGALGYGLELWNGTFVPPGGTVTALTFKP